MLSGFRGLIATADSEAASVVLLTKLAEAISEPLSGLILGDEDRSVSTPRVACGVTSRRRDRGQRAGRRIGNQRGGCSGRERDARGRVRHGAPQRNGPRFHDHVGELDPLHVSAERERLGERDVRRQNDLRDGQRWRGGNGLRAPRALHISRNDAAVR